MTLAGADFYWGNGPVDAKLAGLSFVILKATEGLDYHHDDWLVPSARTVLDEGLALGFYHFGHAGDGPAQWAYFNARVKSVCQLLDVDEASVGRALDQECLGGTMGDADAHAWIVAAHGAGYRVGRYCAAGGYEPAQGEDWRWVADHNGAPAIPWHVWQYAAVGGYGDRDRFDGTIDELRALWLGQEGDDMPDPRISDAEAAALAKLTPIVNQLAGLIAGGEVRRVEGKPRPSDPDDGPYVRGGWDVVDTALKGGAQPPGNHTHETGGAIPIDAPGVTP